MTLPTPSPWPWPRCLIIAEVALAHDGSLGMAQAFLDAAASTGADVVKFQTHIADAESTAEETFRVPMSGQDATRYDYWRRTAFTPDQWHALAERAAACGILFTSSPFSAEAVELLTGCQVPFWKIASGEVSNTPLLRNVAATGLPVVLSSGMSAWTELDAAVGVMHEHGVPFAVVQCTSEYPCPPERVGLNVLAEAAARYGCPVGLSDHSGTIFPSLAAAAHGAAIIEAHITLSRGMYGPDVPASLTVGEFATMVEGVRFIERMRANPVDKDAAAAAAASTRALFTRSIVAQAALEAGTRLAPEHLAYKKPGTGLPPARAGELLGRRLRRGVARDAQLSLDDLEDAG